MDNSKFILIKSYFTAGLLVLISILIVFRLVQIQSGDVEKYKQIAEKTNFRKVDIKAARGNLFSSDGELLATTILKYDVHMDTKTVDAELWEENIDALSDSLSKIWLRSPASIKKDLNQERKQKNQYFLIGRNLDYDVIYRLKNFPIFNKGQMRGGFILSRQTQRLKPVNEFGLRTIGFDDERGSAGLEGAFKEYLRGTDGRQLEQFINGKYWRPIGYWHQDNIDPQDGYDVYTSLNMRIQDIANSALEKQLIEFQAHHGCAVVMEVKTGRILAMANLTRFQDGTYHDVKNYAVGEASEPGSTFKVVSLLAALDDGYIDPNTTVSVGGGSWSPDGKHTIRDDHGSGTYTITQVLSESSNVGTAKTIYKYYRKNPEDFVKKIYDWGLNQKVGIEIKGEANPIIRTPKDPKWSNISLPWMSYGYGVALAPIQILNFYNAIANDGVMVKPRLIDKIESEGNLIDSFSTVVVHKNIATKNARSLMEQMLVQAVENGTAESIFTPNLKMAGKTGTAQYEYWKWNAGNKKYIASFCGYFPADKPIYSCIVVIHQPNTTIGFYGSQVAAPVFKEIAGKVFLKTPLNLPKEVHTQQNFHIEKTFQNARSFQWKAQQKAIPNCVGYYGREVIPALENHGYKVKYKGVGKVLKQSLPPGSTPKKGSTVYLLLEE